MCFHSCVAEGSVWGVPLCDSVGVSRLFEGAAY